MRVCIDIEADGLENPKNIWLIVAKDLDTGEYHIFREVTKNVEEQKKFLELARQIERWVGHNLLNYDIPVICKLIPDFYKYFRREDVNKYVDTLICSKLINYSRQQGHSIESYGEEFGTPKGKFTDFSRLTKEMEDYCVRDVDICARIYAKYQRIIDDPAWRSAILLEHRFQLVVNDLHDNGFCFNSKRASSLLDKVTSELAELDSKILKEFPPRLKLIKEVHPKETKHGTLSRSDFRFVKDGDLSIYNGGPFSRCAWVPFNPASHKQIVEVLGEAGWRPTDKTQAHIDLEREINRLKYTREKGSEVDIRFKDLYSKLELSKISAYKINENNLSTLPSSAPAPARLLAKRILLEARRRTLVEWLGLVQEDGRIHSKFIGLGAWTGRMAHQSPNTANIPNDLDTQGQKKLLGKEMRSLWCAPKNRLLVGVDAEGIQLRIFAHLIDDLEFTQALVEGKKDDKTDPHSLNQRVLGSVCKSRQAAKRFIYALLLGAGLWKLSQILECSEQETKQALDRLLKRYGGYAFLKEEIIPQDARRGWFFGLDGRKVRIPGTTQGERKHLAMSGYLQSGEAIVLKSASLKWIDKLKDHDSLLVNFVHDEYVIETPNNVIIAEEVQHIVSKSIQEVGLDLNLKCPLSGTGDVGITWYHIH